VVGQQCAGIVLGATAGRYRILADDRELVATLRGRMKLRPDRVVVGDAVSIVRHADDAWTIEAVLERRSVLRRRRPGRKHGTHVVAANLEQVIVVGAAAQPAWEPNLIDRFAAVAEVNQLPVVIVINKCDLSGDPGSLASPYRKAGYAVELTSVPERLGLEELRARLAGRTSWLTGPTGVGKSSLLNALQPGLRLRTQAVGRGRGRHTTVATELHRLGSDGLVADTPGLRDIGLWGLEPFDVARAFPEFSRFADQCRFDNCRHLGEPACAVAQAAETDDISLSRLTSYRLLLDEVLAAARPWERPG